MGQYESMAQVSELGHFGKLFNFLIFLSATFWSFLEADTSCVFAEVCYFSIPFFLVEDLNTLGIFRCKAELII